MLIKTKMLCTVSWMLVVFTLAVCIINQQNYIKRQAFYTKLVSNPEETSGFRTMYLTKEMLQSFKYLQQQEDDRRWIEWLAAYMLKQDFIGTGTISEEIIQSLKQEVSLLNAIAPEAYEQLIQAYTSVLMDVSCFPVAANLHNKKCSVSYENTWMFERNYGGSRGHEGTDLIPSINKNDYYPIISMTNGVVEQVGWLEKGGYRIGIRSTNGGYFYYAHLSSYNREFQKGDTVMAGDILGYMGDTGYGPEGTSGMFDAHLHLGIYIQTEHYEELSVNPYWILKYIEDERMYYNF